MPEIVTSFIASIELPDSVPDWHAAYSIQLCELIEAGFEVFGDEDWPSLDWYSDEAKTRLEKKLVKRFYYREIGITPPGEWRHELTRVMGEVLPKYKPLYAALASGSSVLADTDEWHKERHVYSDFPATQLDTETQDYARSAEDHEHETIVTGDWLSKTREIASSYKDVDVMVLDELECCFSCMWSVSANAL